MALNFAGTGHLLGTKPLATATPVFMGLWLNLTSLGQFRRFLSLVSSADPLNNNLILGTDELPAATGKAAAIASVTGPNSNQALTTSAIATNAWQFVYAGFASGSSRFSGWGTAGNELPSSVGIFAPTGIDRTIYSGRGGDFTSGIPGQSAHGLGFTRIPSALERAYLAKGGNPRYLKGLARYWKLTALVAGQTTVPDEMGFEPLTIVGAVTSGASDPAIATFMTGAAIGNQSYAVGAAIPPINLAALFDNVSSSYTVSLMQLGIATQITTASTALAAIREFQVGTVGALVPGDYVQVGVSGQPTLVLMVNASTATILVANDQTAPVNSAVFRLPANALSIPGLSIVSNVFGGAFSSVSSNSNCFFRARCNANNALIADTNPFRLAGAMSIPSYLARHRRRGRLFVTEYHRH